MDHFFTDNYDALRDRIYGWLKDTTQCGPTTLRETLKPAKIEGTYHIGSGGDTNQAFVSETRRETLRRYAIVLRLQDRGSPSVASPFGREKCHWHFSFVGLTPVGSAPASVLATVSETNARSLYRAMLGGCGIAVDTTTE